MYASATTSFLNNLYIVKTSSSHWFFQLNPDVSYNISLVFDTLRKYLDQDYADVYKLFSLITDKFIPDLVCDLQGHVPIDIKHLNALLHKQGIDMR